MPFDIILSCPMHDESKESGKRGISLWFPDGSQIALLPYLCYVLTGPLKFKLNLFNLIFLFGSKRKQHEKKKGLNMGKKIIMPCKFLNASFIKRKKDDNLSIPKKKKKCILFVLNIFDSLW